MKEKALAVWKHVRDTWAGLSTVRRVLLMLFGGTLLAATVALSWLATQVRYAHLFTDLSTDDAAAISTRLKELHVPFRVDPSGNALQVPEDRVHELRLQLAGLGLPRGGGVGFELFDKSQFGATEFEQRVNLRRALEGELARTISSIASVQSARVHLVMPEKTLFAVHHEQASASVVLRLRSSRPFTRAETAAVVHLVATAVPGLTPDRVSVVSADGLTLHRPHADTPSGAGVDEGLSERERDLEGTLEQRVTGLLERAVGPGRAEVRVDVQLDPAARERTEEHYEPTKTALRSEQKIDEHSGAEGASVAGVPGARSNLPDTESDAEPAGEGASAARTSWTRNWEVDRVTEKTNVPPGKVARLSVAVLLDGVYRDVGGRPTWHPREKQEIDRYAELVKGAVGFEASRGDVVQIDTVEFARLSDVPVGTEIGNAHGRPRWMYYAIGGGALLLLTGLTVLVRRRRPRTTRQARALNAAVAPIAIEGTQPRALPRAMTREQAEVVRAEAIQLAGKDPATAAVILREWLNAPSTATPAQARL